MRRWLCSIAILAAYSATANASQLKMQAGLWEDAIAGPDGAFHTEQKCYLQKDIDNIDAFQKGKIISPNQSCHAADYKATGDSISYTLSCTIDGKDTTSQITATYQGTEVTGTRTKDGNVTRLTRRRVGDCSKSSITQ